MLPPHSDARSNAPSAEAVVLVALSIVSFALKYLTSMALANALGIEHYERYAVAIASIVFLSTIVELGLGKQGLRVLPHYIEQGQAELAKGYWRFTLRTVLGVSLGVGLLVVLTQRVPGLASLASDEAMFLLPIVALAGVLAELVLACGAAIRATIVVRVVIPLAPLVFVVWASRSGHAAAVLAPSSAILAYGVGWLLGLAILVAIFIRVCPTSVLRAAPRYDSREWLRSGLGFLGVAFSISALVDGSVVLAEVASVDAADIAIYAVCIETGGFVLILVKSLDKFYLQRISALISRGELGEIQRIRRRRASLMLTTCGGFCLAIVLWGRPLLRSFGDDFERGYFALVCIAFATSAWTLSSLSQWLIAFVEGPARALRITLGGVIATYTAILLLGPRQGLAGIALGYAVMVALMSLLLESRARGILRRLVAEGGPSAPEEGLRHRRVDRDGDGE